MNAPQAFDIKEDIGHAIGGQIVVPQGSRFADVYNPAKGSVSRRVALASKADVNQAVAAAQAAKNMMQVREVRSRERDTRTGGS